MLRQKCTMYNCLPTMLRQKCTLYICLPTMLRQQCTMYIYFLYIFKPKATVLIYRYTPRGLVLCMAGLLRFAYIHLYINTVT
jgi:hypothetical protein